MASGCNETNRGLRPLNTTPDRAVKYTGPNIPSLDICTGDYLDELTAVIVDKLLDYATGEGISLPDTDFTQCDFLDRFTACCLQDKSLQGIINGILSALCAQDEAIADVNTLITTIQNSINYTIVPGCLTAANTKIDTVLNKLINDYCAFKAQVTAFFGGDLDNPVISTTLINQITDSVLNTVFSAIHGCSEADVVRTGTGLSTQITIKGIAPIGSFLYGDWPISYFDGDGLGKAEYGLCGWAIANGNEYVSDMRGFSFAMATNIPGPGGLNPRVDPVLNADADLATNIGSVKGKYKHRLTATESGLPAHTHGITDPTHTHRDGNYDRLLEHTGTKTVQETDNNDSNGREPRLDDSRQIPYSATGITVNPSVAAEAVQAHENRQPTVYVNCIQRIS